MKKISILLITIIIIVLNVHGQGIQQFKGKTYIFDSYEQVIECDNLGNTLAGATPITAEKGSLFTVERVPDATHYVIKFNDWKTTTPKNLAKRAMYNFSSGASLKAGGKPTEIQRFFLLLKTTFDASCSEHPTDQRWQLSIGTLTTPFKFRSKPFLFTSNLNLGTSVSYQHKIKTNFTWGAIGGLSLSSVTLDSFSTKGVVKTNTDRPAVTPSFHFMIGYKNINITAGIGWDFINKTSELEKSWVYYGRRWFGIGIGINLFNTNTNSQGTPATAGQK